MPSHPTATRGPFRGRLHLQGPRGMDCLWSNFKFIPTSCFLHQPAARQPTGCLALSSRAGHVENKPPFYRALTSHCPLCSPTGD